MKTLITCIILVLLSVINVSAATLTATSCEIAEVQSKVTAAERGDTVIVPPGNCIWSSRLNLTKAIRLVGAGRGTDGSVITWAYGTETTDLCGDCPVNFSAGGGYGSIKMKSSDPQADENTVLEITGFRFVGKSDVYRIGGIMIVHCSVDYPLRKVMIHGNDFRFRTDASAHRYPLWVNMQGYIAGVVYDNYVMARHPYFYPGDGNSMDDKLVGSYPGDGCTWPLGRHSWTMRTYRNGQQDQLYFEDNTIVWTNMSGIHFGGTGFGGLGFVMRYNDLVFYESDNTYVNGFENHGAYYWQFGATGQEVYGNLFDYSRWLSARNSNIMFCRSGRCIGWGNAFLGPYAAEPRPSVVHECFEGSMGVVTGHSCPAGTKYPTASGYRQVCASDGQPQHPYNSYFFKNFSGVTSGTTLGTHLSLSAGPGEPAGTMCSDGATQVINWGTLPRENTDVWVSNPTSCNASGCTAGIGCGTTKPGTCTAGTGWWETSQSCDTLAASYVGANATKQTGVLYRCKSTGNSWEVWYTPLDYPHPLRGTVDTDTEDPVISSTTPTGTQACSGSANVTMGVDATDNTAVTGCKICKDGVGGCTSASEYADMNITLTNTTGNAWRTTITESCGQSIKYNGACIDAQLNESAVATISFQTNPTTDPDPPTISTKTIGTDGRTLTLVFSEPVKVGSGGSGGFTLTNGSAYSYTLTYQSGSLSNTLVYQANECIPSTDTFTNGLKYTQPGSGIEDIAGNDLATDGSGTTVTNSSTQDCGAATSLWYPDVPTYTTNTDVPSNLGVKFSSTVAGTLTHVCYYKDSVLTGTHTASVWNDQCSKLAEKVISSDTGTGWKCQELDTSVDILADTSYKVAVHFPTSAYIKTGGNLYSGYGEMNLAVPAGGGFYFDSSGVGCPTVASSSNFWVDFIMEYQGASGPWSVEVSKSGAGCEAITYTENVPLVTDGNTATITTKVANGWAISMASSTCPAGSGTLTGNFYTYTTGAIGANCTIVSTCAEVKFPVWVAP